LRGVQAEGLCVVFANGVARSTGERDDAARGAARWPEVLRAGGLDPEKHQGFAFGIGVDRITMLRHQINDIRLLYDNEEAFLRQF
jgi:hypothetical protein